MQADEADEADPRFVRSTINGPTAGIRGVELSLDNYHDNYRKIIEIMAESDDNAHQPATCSDLICRDYLTLSTWYGGELG